MQYLQDSLGCPYINETNLDFISHHFDIINISQDEYIKIANIIMKKIENDDIEILSINDVKSVTKELCLSGIVYKEKLNPSMRETISKL